MTEGDDELRDEFGDKLRDALSTRAHGETPMIVAAEVERLGRTDRTRRRAFASAVAAVVVIALVGVGLIATHQNARHVDVVSPASTSTSTSTASTTTISAPPGLRVVRYHDVRVEVPASWPVVDGMHTGFCGGPFLDTPTAFVGPQENGAPSCPAPSPSETNTPRYGVWLYASPTPSDAHAVKLAGGQTIYAEDPAGSPTTYDFWFHDVSVTVGLGPDQHVVKHILASLAYERGAADTPATGVCARIPNPDAMPTPERLGTRIVLEQGTTTLDPVLPTDQPTMTAAQAWASVAPKENFEHYRLVLTRYSSKFPATQHADGTLTPENQNELSWVVLSAPNSPEIAGCGGWGYDATDARTGKGIVSAGYSPGP